MHKVGALLIGAQKAGTTSLYQYVRQHPEISFSYVKELTFFLDAGQYDRGVDYYHEFFAGGDDDCLRMSSHVHMLASDDAPARVLQYNPDMKFIVLLREPVSRAWSAFNYAKANGWETDSTSFLDALDFEAARKASNDHRLRLDLTYFYNGLYWRHLSRWLRYFDRDRFLVLRSIDLRDDRDGCLQRIWSFLKVDPNVHVDASREYNRARNTRWRWLTRLLYDKNSQVKSTLNRVLPPKVRIWTRRYLLPLVFRVNTFNSNDIGVPADVRSALEKYFRDDLRKLDDTFAIRFE